MATTGLTRYTSRRDPLLRMMDDFVNRSFLPTLWREGSLSEDATRGDWVPAVDISEEDDRFLVTAELPGMKKKDIDISLENGVLTLKGERKWESEEKKRTDLLRMERAYGQFVRSFTLPSQVEPDEVKASFEDGVLTVELPKSERARSSKIAIQ